MSQDLRASISAMKHAVAKLREYDRISDEDRDRLVEIFEEQIREMEHEQAGAWS